MQIRGSFPSEPCRADSGRSPYLVLRESGTCGQFEQECSRLRQILLEYGRMEDDLLLRGECIQFSSQTIKVTVYYRSTSAFCALEDGMFYEMRNAAVEPFFISSAASDAQRTISDG